MHTKFAKVVSAVLIAVCLVCGAAMLFFGVRGSWRLHQTTARYRSVDGYFSDYSVYSADRDGTTYRLTYSYTVDGHRYTLSTDYGSGSLPEAGSVKTVLYNPDNPEEAVLSGVNRYTLLLWMGGLFTLAPLVFILGWLTVEGRLRRFSLDPLGLVIGLALIGAGAGSIYMIAGSFSLGSAFAAGPWVLIPLILTAAGLYQTVRCLFQGIKPKPRGKSGGR